MSTIVHSRGVGGQNWLNLTHVVVECPLVVRVRRPSTIFFPGLQALHKCEILLLFSFRCMLFFKLPAHSCMPELASRNHLLLSGFCSELQLRQYRIRQSSRSHWAVISAFIKQSSESPDSPQTITQPSVQSSVQSSVSHQKVIRKSSESHEAIIRQSKQSSDLISDYHHL